MKTRVWKTVFIVSVVSGGLVTGFSEKLHAQDDDRSLSVFFDCGYCDTEYVKQNVVFINYANERKDADLHVLVTRRLAGDTEEHQFRFIGSGKFKDQDQLIVLPMNRTDTPEESRQRFTRALIFGLLRYIAGTPLAKSIEVKYDKNGNNVVSDRDRWNHWIFRVTAGGYLNVEEKSKLSNMHGSLVGGRTTERWKFNGGVSGSNQKSTHDLSDSSRIKSSTDSLVVFGLGVKSLSEHWGVGSGVTMQRSDYYNLRPSYRAAMAIEYNLFPYNKSSERTCTLGYFVGVTHLNYVQETVLSKTRENLPTQGLNLSLGVTRPWGNVSASANLSHLGGLDRLHWGFGANVTWRLVRGLSFNTYGNMDFIADQVYLAKSSLSVEDILLSTRARATDFSYYAGVGLTISFGSKHSNTVNARLDSTTSFQRIF